MEDMICKTCGGSVKEDGDFYVCENCQSKWPINAEDKANVEKNETQENLSVKEQNIDAEALENSVKKDSSEGIFIEEELPQAEASVTLEKITIHGGEESVKAKELTLDFVQIRATGKDAIMQFTTEDAEKLAVVDSFLEEEKWLEATEAVERVLEGNPTCGEAFWKKLLIEKRAINGEALLTKLNEITEEDLLFLNKIFECVSDEAATEILDTLYGGYKSLPQATYCRILKEILPYEYKNRDARIKEVFKWSMQTSKMQVFTLLFTTFQPSDVEKYIKYNCVYAKNTAVLVEKKECLDRIFQVDEGNMEALKIMLYLQLSGKTRYTIAIKTFEKILKYSKNQSAELDEMLAWLLGNLNTQEDCALVKEFLRYDQKDISNRKDELLAFANAMIKGGFFEDAEYLSRLVLSFDELNVAAYWNLCLIQVGATSEDKILKSKIPLTNASAYPKYLTLVEEARRIECDKIVLAQQKALSGKKRFHIDTVTAVGVAAIAVVVATAVLTISLVAVPSIRYDKAQKLLYQGKYEKAYEILEALGDYKDADKLLKDSIYKRAKEQIVLGNDVEAYRLLKRVKGYEDSNLLISELRVRVKKIAEEYAQTGKYEEAIAIADQVEIAETDFPIYQACKLILDGKYKEAVVLGLTYVVVPEGVSTIEKKAFYDTDITTVILPRTLKKIEESAFEKCNRLQNIKMYDGITSIGNRAFYSCGIKSITLPKKLESIGALAFFGCKNLREITIPNSVTSIGNQAFYDCSNIEIYSQLSEAPKGWSSNWNKCSPTSDCPVYWNYGGLIEVTKHGFTWMLLADGSGVVIMEYEGTLSEVIIPDKIDGFIVRSIYPNAFEANRTITKVTLPKTIESIGASAFSNCIKLQEIVLPEGLTSIEDNAFENCSSLTRLIIPSSVTEIGNNVFYGCVSLNLYCQHTDKPNSFNIGWNVSAPSKECPVVWGWLRDGATENGLEWMEAQDGFYIIGYTGTESKLSVPATIEGKKILKICDEAFANNTRLTQVTVHNYVKSIGFGAFRGCANLKILTIPFVGGEKENPSDNTHFGYIFGAIRSAQNSTYVPTSLYSVILTDTTNIYRNSFEGCYNLTSIELPRGLKVIADNAFFGCYRLKRVINLSKTLTIAAHTTTNGCVGYYADEIITDANNIGEYYTENGYHFYRAPISGTYYLVSYTGTSTTLTLPEWAGTTGDQPYVIGSYAFYNCNLTKITMPANVIEIGEYAFKGNVNLVSALVKDITTCKVYDPATSSTPISIDIYSYADTATYLKNTYVKYRWLLRE